MTLIKYFWKKDMEKALSWYEKAAAQGNVFAIDHLRFISAPR